MAKMLRPRYRKLHIKKLLNEIGHNEVSHLPQFIQLSSTPYFVCDKLLISYCFCFWLSIFFKYVFIFTLYSQARN